MTSVKQRKKIKKNDNNKNEEDTIGPKIRHPSGDVYPDIIFLSEKNDEAKLSSAARLYQDIIKYSISKEYTNELQEQNERKAFKITAIVKWIKENNRDYRNFYTDSDSKIPKKVRDDGIIKRIHRYIDNLVKWDLISKFEQIDTNAHNGQKTFMYKYTDYAYILAWMFEYNNSNNNSAKKQIAKNEIFNLLQGQFKKFNSYRMDFLARIYDKFYEHSLFDHLITLVILSIKNQKFPNIAEYFSFTQSIILNKSLDLYFEALKDFQTDVRRKIIEEEKYVFESTMWISQPPKIWHEVCSENKNNHDKIVLYGKCQNKDCSVDGHVIYDYYAYRKAIASSPDPYSRYSVMECQECKIENAFHVYSSMNNFGI